MSICILYSTRDRSILFGFLVVVENQEDSLSPSVFFFILFSPLQEWP